MPRYFKLDEAQQLLPQVDELLREAMFLLTEHQESQEKLSEQARRITLQGGVNIDRDDMAKQRARREMSALRLKSIIEKVQDLGCQVKDLKTGLIDFPTLYRGEEVLLCWRVGEAGISFWHGLEEGFQGRKPIDRDFLDHHSSELSN